MTETIETPECDKALKHRDESLFLSNFVDWLEENGYAVCTLEATPGYPSDQWIPHRKPFGEIFADYYGIDSNAMEKEKLAILQALRENNKPL